MGCLEHTYYERILRGIPETIDLVDKLNSVKTAIYRRISNVHLDFAKDLNCNGRRLGGKSSRIECYTPTLPLTKRSHIGFDGIFLAGENQILRYLPSQGQQTGALNDNGLMRRQNTYNENEDNNF